MSLTFHEFVSHVHSLPALARACSAVGGGASPPAAVEEFVTFEAPPTNNMGVELPEEKPSDDPGRVFGIHWYSGTSRAKLDDVLRAVTKCLGCELGDDEDFRSVWTIRPVGRNGYHRMFMGPAGTFVCFTSGRDDVHFCLPGQACEASGMKRLIALMTDVQHHPTRVDLAWDGMKGPGGVDLSPAWLNALVRGNPEQVRTPAKIKIDENIPREKRTKSIDFHQNGQGETFSLGSPSSDRRCVFYNRRGPTRCELRLRRDYAVKFVECAMEKSPERLEAIARGMLRDYVEFLEPGGDGHHKSRDAVVSWWASFVGGVERIALAAERPIRSAVEKVAWFLRQCGPTAKAFLELRMRAAVDKATGVCMSFEEAGAELVEYIGRVASTAGSTVLVARNPFGLDDEEMKMGFRMATG